MGPIGCPETSVINSHCSLSNDPEEHSSHLLRGGSLKPRIRLGVYLSWMFRRMWVTFRLNRREGTQRQYTLPSVDTEVLYLQVFLGVSDLKMTYVGLNMLL
jgi:hypothetical protein